MAIRGLLVDFYGTLVHEDDIPVSQITSQIEAHAVPGTTRTEIARFWYETFVQSCAAARGTTFVTQESLAVSTLARTFRKFGVDLDPEEILAPQFAHWHNPPLFPDTQSFLQTAKACSLPVYVVSNIDRTHIQSAMRLHNLTVDGVITSEDARSYKPDAFIFDVALEECGLSRSEILHVGDSFRNDVEGASAAGIAVAWLNRSGKQPPGNVIPDHTVSSLHELGEILAALSTGNEMDGTRPSLAIDRPGGER